MSARDELIGWLQRKARYRIHKVDDEYLDRLLDAAIAEAVADERARWTTAVNAAIGPDRDVTTEYDQGWCDALANVLHATGGGE